MLCTDFILSEMPLVWHMELHLFRKRLRCICHCSCRVVSFIQGSYVSIPEDEEEDESANKNAHEDEDISVDDDDDDDDVEKVDEDVDIEGIEEDEKQEKKDKDGVEAMECENGDKQAENGEKSGENGEKRGENGKVGIEVEKADTDVMEGDLQDVSSLKDEDGALVIDESEESAPKEADTPTKENIPSALVRLMALNFKPEFLTLRRYDIGPWVATKENVVTKITDMMLISD